MSSSAPRPLVLSLTAEHAVLERALALFARLAEWIGARGAFDLAEARRLLGFFDDYGDRRHHEKEELRLFRWMEEQGLPHASGPLLVLRQEHELDRDLRRDLAQAVEALGEAPEDAAARQCFRERAQRYVEFMRAHIQKEEQALFPLAECFADQSGQACLDPDQPAEPEMAWLDALEARADGWPPARPGTGRFGTPYAFGRLCEQALT